MKTWFKFYGQEFLTDPKMLSLTAIEKALWLTMLCLASASDEEGVIKYIDEQKIMTLTGIDRLEDEWSENEGFLKKFESLSMITLDNDMITLLNFNKRQETNLTGYERVKRFREKHKEDEANNDETDDNVINDNVRIDKNRIEKSREDNITKEATQSVAVERQDTNSLIPLFEPINPAYKKFYKNKTQHEALDRLIDKYTHGKMRNLLIELPRIMSQRYAPTITTPLQLEDKMGALVQFLNRQKLQQGESKHAFYEEKL